MKIVWGIKQKSWPHDNNQTAFQLSVDTLSQWNENLSLYSIRRHVHACPEDAR